jgi:hypothetical protein
LSSGLAFMTLGATAFVVVAGVFFVGKRILVLPDFADRAGATFV